MLASYGMKMYNLSKDRTYNNIQSRGRGEISMFDKIDNQSVVNIVLNQIKDSIMSGEIKPGDKIPTEVELMEQIGVGRNSIREAIKMLIALGVLEVKRGQGTFVATKVKPTFFDPLIFSLIIENKTDRDLYELRYMFDSMVLLNVLGKATEEDIMQIEQCIIEMKEMYESKKYEKDFDFFVKKDLEFHRIILEATRNPLVIRIGQSIINLFPEYMKRSMRQKHGVKRSIENHMQILEVIKNKDSQHFLDITEKTLMEWKNEWKESEDD